MSEPLLPCPWCYEEVSISTSNYPSMVIISCGNVDKCAVLPSWVLDAHGELEKTKSEMIKTWNTRTPPPPSVKWTDPYPPYGKAYDFSDLTQRTFQEGWNACINKCKELNAPNVTKIEVYGGLEGKPKTHMATYINTEPCDHISGGLGSCPKCGEPYEQPSEKKESDHELTRLIADGRQRGLTAGEVSDSIINAGWFKKGRN